MVKASLRIGFVVVFGHGLDGVGRVGGMCGGGHCRVSIVSMKMELSIYSTENFLLSRRGLNIQHTHYCWAHALVLWNMDIHAY